MNATLVLGVVAIGLFVGAYFSKRRFGVLAAGLAIGWTLSSFWGSTASLMISLAHSMPNHILQPISLAAVTLVPAVILLFHGPRYKTMVSRVVGSFLFVALALTFIVSQLAPVMITPGISKQIVGRFETNHMIVLSALLALAVADLFMISGHHHEAEKGRKH